MSDDYIGIKRFCDLCVHSTKKNNNVICNNKASKYNGIVVNGVLLAPCMKQKKFETEKVIETVSFD